MQHTLAFGRTCSHAELPRTLISFFPDVSQQDREIHSKYGTNHEHELEGYFSVRKLSFHYSDFSMSFPKNVFFTKNSRYLCS